MKNKNLVLIAKFKKLVKLLKRYSWGEITQETLFEAGIEAEKFLQELK